MGTDPTSVVQRLCERLTADGVNGPADGELLAAFAVTRGEAEFAALLTRHGPMVLGVCRRLLGNAADADDAFQAVFLVLARRAGALSAPSVAGWLYGTAVRVALKARTREARRRAREQKAALMRPDATDPNTNTDWADLRTVLDEELQRLSARYRDPIVLCLLEGRSREEAAKVLGCPEGTVNGRLARAKELLRTRLARRGVVCSVSALTALLSANGASAVPVELVRTTLSTVAGTAPAGVAALAAETGSGWGRLALATVAGLTAAGVLLAFGSWFRVEPIPPIKPPAPDHPTAVSFAHGSEVLALAVSGSGLVATAGPGPDVRIWKADGTLAAKCSLPGGACAVVFAPDGKTVAAAGYDGTVRVWEVPSARPEGLAATGTLRHTLAGHGDSAQAVTFSPDGSQLATAGEDGHVRLWDAATGKPLHTLEGHTGRVWGLSFSPDGRELASAGGDQTVRIWNTTTGTETRRFGGLRGGVYAIEYHPSGRVFAVAAHNAVLLLDTQSGRELGRVGSARTAVTWFAFAPDGRSLAYRDGKSVRLWEMASGAERLTLELSAEPGAVCFAPLGRTLIVASGDGADGWDLRRHVRPLPAADPNALWAHLSGADAALAFRAVESLAGEPAKSVPLVREKLHAFADFRTRVGVLVQQLGDDEFAVREKASKQLEAIGQDAGPALRRALTEDTSPEVRDRAGRLLKRFPASATQLTPTESRAVEVLEKVATPEAREVLGALAAREHDSPLKREAAAALSRLQRTRP
jgi:RNA polymerase sigma factor (sigma-70 family)